MAGLLATLRRSTQDLRAQFASNRRLAAMVLFIPGIALLYAALLVQDAISAAAGERVPLAHRAARLAAVADGTDWQQRIIVETERRAGHEAALWRADSPELAAADLQTVLQRVAATHLSWNRLKLVGNERIEDIGGWRITGELTGKLKADNPLALLQEIGEHSPRILVDRFDVSRLRGQTVTMQLSVLVVPEGSAP